MVSYSSLTLQAAANIEHQTNSWAGTSSWSVTGRAAVSTVGSAYTSLHLLFSPIDWAPKPY